MRGRARTTPGSAWERLPQHPIPRRGDLVWRKLKTYPTRYLPIGVGRILSMPNRSSHDIGREAAGRRGGLTIRSRPSHVLLSENIGPEHVDRKRA